MSPARRSTNTAMWDGPPQRWPDIPGTPPGPWAERALCAGFEPSIFYPRARRGPKLTSLEQRAKTICNACPVLTECRAHALNTGEPHGIWGALTEQERAALTPPRRPR